MLDKTFSEIVKRLTAVLVSTIFACVAACCGFVLFAHWLKWIDLDSLPWPRSYFVIAVIASVTAFAVSLPFTWIAYRRQRMEDNRKRMEDNRKRERGRQIGCAIRRSQSEARERDKDDPSMG
jgi:hypothetical protein